MSQNCNRVVEQLADDAVEAKASFARFASAALSGALSECHRAIELAHTELNKACEVYLTAADRKLAAAIEALREVDSIMRSSPIGPEALAWTQSLDFDRLYLDGVTQGFIPGHPTQWARLADMNKGGHVLSISNALIEDLQVIRGRIEHVIETIGDGTERRNRAGVPYAMLSLQSAILDAAAFAQMVAYVNTLEPLDPSWVIREVTSQKRVAVTA